MEITEKIWKDLEKHAWDVRESAFLKGNTKVGAALISEKGNIYSGCNIEHQFRCHDVHAEVNAISSMVATGEEKFIAILITAEKYKFTPCGSCMDWIMQHGGEDCIVAYKNSKEGKRHEFTAKELMPHYPKAEA